MFDLNAEDNNKVNGLNFLLKYGQEKGFKEPIDIQILGIIRSPIQVKPNPYYRTLEKQIA